MLTVKLAYDLYIPESEDSELCPIITMHGLFMNKIMLSKVSKKTADATRRKVYCVDLRNHGDSPSPSESNCYMMAEDICLFFQDHNISKASFVCHSFSTRIASVFAIDQPHMVEKLIFLDFYPYADLDKKYNDFTNATKVAIESVVSTVNMTGNPDEIKTELREKLLKNKQTGWVYQFLELLVTECVIDEQGIRLKYDTEATINFFLRGRYRLPPYGTYDGPVLLISGERSPFCKSIRSNINELKKYFPKGEYISISDGTHLLPIEKPDECADAIQKFLEI